jgi:hypothetical protein
MSLLLRHELLPDSPAVRHNEPLGDAEPDCNTLVICPLRNFRYWQCPVRRAFTEIVEKKYPRATSPEMTAAREKELRGLIERGAFGVALDEEVPADANILRGRLVLAIKETGTDREV